MTYHPDTDGITHINVYSKGRTELGRRLSNFRSELKASVLPLAHYYVYAGKVVDVSHKHRWQLDGMEQLRAELQEDDDARRMM